jgi:hypothetical protein
MATTTKTRRRKAKRPSRSTWSGSWLRVTPEPRPLDAEREQLRKEMHEAIDALYDETKLPGELGAKARVELDALTMLLSAVNDHADIPLDMLRRAEWPEDEITKILEAFAPAPSKNDQCWLRKQLATLNA